MSNYHPIVRELLHQKEQGYLQEVQGKVDANTSFEVRLYENREDLGELVISLRGLSAEDAKPGLQEIVKGTMMRSYGWVFEIDAWESFKRHKKEEAEKLECKLGKYCCSLDGDLTFSAGGMSYAIFAEHQHTITAVTIGLPIKSLEQMPLTELNFVLNYILLFKEKKQETSVAT